MIPTSRIEIYESDDGQTQIDVRLEHETLGLSQVQMAAPFERDSDTIGLHLKTIYLEGELNESSTTEESSVVRYCGKLQGRSDDRYYTTKLKELLMKPSPYLQVAK